MGKGEANAGSASEGGDRRGVERRSGDRRRDDRRTPVPFWRRPWALVLYGVAGALAVVALVVPALGALGGGDEEPAAAERVVPAAPAVGAAAPPPPSAAPAEEAFGAEGFERMVLRGTDARGRRVRTLLYCAAPRPVALQGDPAAEPDVRALAGEDRRVRAAECKWGDRGDVRREDVVLVIPPHLAEEFAAAPVVEDDFVRRRRLPVELEWVGRSDALALRTAAILRAVLPPE